uniref:PH01B001I13.27 protein n=1 Tax=Phyllostachys edulis TaxID=38705 RepID=L0P1M3_PHYED|nr:PH01B001I13.27 [Phyllostachys edulis]
MAGRRNKILLQPGGAASWLLRPGGAADWSGRPKGEFQGWSGQIWNYGARGNSVQISVASSGRAVQISRRASCSCVVPKCSLGSGLALSLFRGVRCFAPNCASEAFILF